jgi:hypothetical protein
MKKLTLHQATLIIASATLLSACSAKGVSYKQAVEPILKQNCHACHLLGGEGQVQSGLDMSSYDSLMKGTKFGPIIKPGDSLSSVLIMLVEGRADPSIRMPHNGNRMEVKDIQTLKSWVEQGAKNN